jgi:CubicO group peptidase (beta-lactamase class C family)
VSLDAPAASYLPAWPYDRDATVRQLLSHTAGLPNPIPLRWVHHADTHDTFDEHAALKAVLRQHGRTAGRPGIRFAYSNIGYWLLGAIVEQVTHRPFAEIVTERILRPLALSPHDLAFRIVDWPAHATGYVERWSLANIFGAWLMDPALLGADDGSWRRIGAHYPNGPAFGGLVGTARAFARLLQDQLQPRSVLLGDRARAWLYEVQSTRDGVPVPMTLGWHVTARDGETLYFKEGGGGGYHCLMWISPQRQRGSVLMSNATGLDVRVCLEGADRARDEDLSRRR